MRVIYLNYVEPNFLRERFMKGKDAEIRALKEEIFIRRLNIEREDSNKMFAVKGRNITYMEMTEKTAQETAAKAFVILQFLFKVLPPRFSGGDGCGEITIKCHPDGSFPDIIGRVRPASEDEVEVVYRVLHDGKIYKIELLDSEDTYGYMSCSPKWDPETYVFCNFKEERPDGTKRCEMDFAFDIEKKTFVELFLIEYYNNSGLIRRCEQIEHFEKLFLGEEII